MVIKFGGFAQTMYLTLLADLKLAYGTDRHMYMHAKTFFMYFNLAVKRYTTKPPNLIPHKISPGYTVVYYIIQINKFYLREI